MKILWKRALVIAGGFFGYIFLEGFIRLIIMFYHRDEFHFYGISHLPANNWTVIILISVLIITWLVTMMVLSILDKKPALNASVLCIVFLAWRGFEISNSYHLEPMWYFMVVACLHIAGSFLAYQLYIKQYENILKS